MKLFYAYLNKFPTSQFLETYVASEFSFDRISELFLKIQILKYSTPANQILEDKVAAFLLKSIVKFMNKTSPTQCCRRAFRRDQQLSSRTKYWQYYNFLLLYNNNFFNKFKKSSSVLIWCDSWYLSASTMFDGFGSLCCAFFDAVMSENVDEGEEINFVMWTLWNYKISNKWKHRETTCTNGKKDATSSPYRIPESICGNQDYKPLWCINSVSWWRRG